MQIFAGITLSRGHAVQLYKGSPTQKTVLLQSPARLAEWWAADGVDGFYVLDLDGELAGAPANLKTLAGICRTQKPVWMAGGITSAAAAEACFAAGATGVAAGTAAVENVNLLQELLAKFGAEKVAGTLTAYESGTRVSLHAGQRETPLETVAVAESWAATGLTRLFFTDLPRASTLTFPNFEVSERLAAIPNLQVFTGGGVTKPQHIRLLKSAGCAGIVVARALTDGTLTLAELQNHLNS